MEPTESYCEIPSAPEISCPQSENPPPLNACDHPPVCLESVGTHSSTEGYAPFPHHSGYQPVLVYVPLPRPQCPPPYESEHQPQLEHQPQCQCPPQTRNSSQCRYPEESFVSIDNNWRYQSNNSQSKASAADKCRKIDVPQRSRKSVFYRILGITTTIIILIAVVCGLIFGTKWWHSRDAANMTDAFNGDKSLRLVTRDEWLAQIPSEGLEALNLPVHRVIIAHTATDVCTSQASCTYRARVIQTLHMKARGFMDIAYNFLVGGDGSVYVGRGWDQQGAHTKGYNVDSVCIAFIGMFANVPPPEQQLNAAKLLIEEGIRLNKLVRDYRLYGSRQLIGTEGPGSSLYEIIKKWPKWSSVL